jgi:hypothetical protein
MQSFLCVHVCMYVCLHEPKSACKVFCMYVMYVCVCMDSGACIMVSELMYVCMHACMYVCRCKDVSRSAYIGV